MGERKLEGAYPKSTTLIYNDFPLDRYGESLLDILPMYRKLHDL